ncbi:COMPASS component SDC1 [Yarrowia sp. E02]|nr:COMPASS component SDC1 [Yarrowia sp. E02]
MADTPMTDAFPPAAGTDAFVSKDPVPEAASSVSETLPTHTATPPTSTPTPAAEAIKQETISTASLPNPAENYGAPTRLWLNKEVTPALLAGMRQIAKDKPEDPVKALGEFLINYKS